jgi:hypothetical protein
MKTIIALFFVLLVSMALAYETLQGPTELRFWDKEKAFNGYTLFGARGTSYLIDMEGRVLHTWPIGTNPHLLENGDILDASKDDPSGFPGFKEVDWDGKTVWEYAEKRPDYAPHHDWVRIFNKKLNAYTTLYIANRAISNEQAIARGADPRNGPYDGASVDAIVEVDRSGKVVWEWWFFDHLVQDLDPTKANYAKSIAERPGRLNINLPGRPLHRDWLHCNAIDYNSQLDQIVTSSVQGEFYVIDHANGGDFLYRFGDPARYGQGDPPRVLENWDAATSGHKQIGGVHDVQWIAPGLPGAGHFLLFNNGQYLFQRTPQSSVLEIDGFLDGSGRGAATYVNPPQAGYREERYDRDTHNLPRLISKQIVWSYSSKNNHGFFSQIGCSAQRLPNGGTLICSGTEGHIFEIAKDGALAWEYISPLTNQGAVKLLTDNLPMTNALFRAYRYAPGDPALKGRLLTPKSVITEMPPQAGERQPPRPPGQRKGKNRE